MRQKFLLHFDDDEEEEKDAEREILRHIRWRTNILLCGVLLYFALVLPETWRCNANPAGFNVGVKWHLNACCSDLSEMRKLSIAV